MKPEISFFGIAFMIISIGISAQVPPQTVTFKVRKKTIPQEEYFDIIDPAPITQEEGVWFVEENAMFQGGDLSAFSSWIAKHIQYPPDAADKQIIGKVVVQFSVDKQGNIVSPKIIRGVHPSLDNEAVRVVSTSPKWQPAKISGLPVKQNFVIPIVFTLQ